MHDPREPHLNAIKRVLRYLQGTTDLGLQLFWSTTSQLIAYSDADWASCSATRQSTFGYCVFLADNILMWSSKCQDTLSRSSGEAEYRRVANAIVETSWIRNLLCELHTLLSIATMVDCLKVRGAKDVDSKVDKFSWFKIKVDDDNSRPKSIVGSSSDLNLSFGDPLYLHPNDTSGTPIATIKLTGT
ncbi:ribonuclease H-like domain-containing protein [Tanacetum coccineum]